MKLGGNSLRIRSDSNQEVKGENGGQGGIRTHGALAGSPHFECGAIDHSTTCPFPVIRDQGGIGKVF